MHREIKKRWPNTRVVFRGDGGFCRDLIMGFCEKFGIEYIIGLPKNSRLKKQSKAELDEAIAQYEEQLSAGVNSPKGRVIGEFEYQTVKSWKKARRVVSRVEYTEKGENPRYIVTNMKGSPEHLYEEVYCQRGEMENRIKEQQRQMFGDRASCHEMVSNQLRLTLSAAAYVLVKELRNQALQGTELECCEVATIRERLLKIGAQITISARRFCIALASNFPRKGVFTIAAQRLGLDTS
ncbi:MAG: IS1380 family transposase [Planctomycetes bacterium]|nr:IS1380 family transposase [Planctomycetota bacterium]